MPSKPPACRFSVYGRGLLGAVALAGGLLSTAQAEERDPERPAAAMLLDRLCADTLRPNEEDRLFGMISITVRATIKYQGGVFSPDLIDDALQDALGAMLDACPRLAAMDDADRLGQAVELARDATINRLRDAKSGYSGRQTEKATAADLSEELSVQEIDAWLEALSARRRALAVLLYAPELTDREMADAVGLPLPALAAALHGVKTGLLKFFRAESDGAPPPPISPPLAVEHSQAASVLATLLKPDAASPAAARITGISRDVYAGWSLFAAVTGLPPDRALDLGGPILLEPDGLEHRRMIAVALDEISDPQDEPRRFLLKAFAIDADKEGAGLRDGFHLAGAALDNPQARRTLGNPNLASIEIARCLWHDYGTAGDPGLCR